MAKKPKKARRASTKSPRPAGPAVHSRLEPRRPLDRGDVTRLSIVVAVALILRLTYFFVNKATNPTFFHPSLDAAFHHRWALDILYGNFWGDEVFFRAPLYPYFLALIYRMNESIAFAVLFQHLLGCATVVLVYLLARHYFTQTVALLAGLLAALYWPFIFFEGELLIVTLFTFLATTSLLVLVKALENERATWYAASGAAFGFAAVARPSILILLPAIPFLVRWYTGTAGAWRRATLLVAAGALVVIAPVLVRNYVVGRDVVPIASQGGVNFYIGNNPEANGTRASLPGVGGDLESTMRGATELAERDAGRELKPSEVSNYYLRKGLSFIITQPAMASSLMFKKLRFFWSGVERSNTKYIEFYWRRFGLGRLPLPGFWFVAPFGLLGAVVLWPRRRKLSLMYAFLILYSLGVVAFFINSRFRLPVLPVLIVFAAYAISYLFWLFRHDGSRVWGALALFALCAVAVNHDFIKFRGVRSIDEALANFQIGNAYMAAGKRDEALVAFQAARDMQERYPTAGYNAISNAVDFHLGTMYWRNGDYERAIPPLERIMPTPEGAASTAHLLADCYLKTGRPDRAVAAYMRLLEVAPDDKRGLLGLVRTYNEMGREADARAYVERLRALYPNDPDVIRELQMFNR